MASMSTNVTVGTFLSCVKLSGRHWFFLRMGYMILFMIKIM